jgi:phosphatidate phosphatase PAH1
MKTYKEFMDESSLKFKKKFIKLVEPTAKADAIEAQYKGNKPAQDKADRSLNLVSKVRNRMLGLHKPVYESVESDLQQLDNHVTNTMPDNKNITKMHDMIHNISKTHGVSANKLYDNIKDNSAVHQKYRDAATE